MKESLKNFQKSQYNTDFHFAHRPNLYYTKQGFITTDAKRADVQKYKGMEDNLGTLGGTAYQ